MFACPLMVEARKRRFAGPEVGSLGGFLTIERAKKHEAGGEWDSKH
jgi:hypothetical protein